MNLESLSSFVVYRNLVFTTLEVSLKEGWGWRDGSELGVPVFYTEDPSLVFSAHNHLYLQF